LISIRLSGMGRMRLKRPPISDVGEEGPCRQEDRGSQIDCTVPSFHIDPLKHAEAGRNARPKFLGKAQIRSRSRVSSSRGAAVSTRDSVLAS